MANLLDEPLSDIKVKLLNSTKSKSRFNFVKWIRNAKLKTAQLIRENDYQIAEWILNMDIPDKISKTLPAKIQSLIKLVKNTKYKNSADIKPDQTHEFTIEPTKLSRESESAFKKNVVVYEMKVLDHMDCLSQMSLLDSRKTELLANQLEVLKGVKCNETIKVSLEKQGAVDDTIIENSFTFTSKPGTITNKNDIAPVLQRMRDDILTRIDRYTMGGSGWTIGAIILHNLHITRYNPLVARSYIALPAGIQNRKATINIKNIDDKCFIYCLGRAMDPDPEKKIWNE